MSFSTAEEANALFNGIEQSMLSEAWEDFKDSLPFSTWMSFNGS